VGTPVNPDAFRRRLLGCETQKNNATNSQASGRAWLLYVAPARGEKKKGEVISNINVYHARRCAHKKECRSRTLRCSVVCLRTCRLVAATLVKVGDGTCAAVRHTL